MRRQLPARPHLEHLKSQAKDLLDAHRRGEPSAFERIRASVPAFAHMADDALARAPFALHDAQSAIAREYGCVSWTELRDKVDEIAAHSAAAAPAAPLASADQIAQLAASGRVSPELAAALRDAVARRGAGAGVPTPAMVPVLPLRNAVVFPGAVLPIDVSRSTTVRALEAALAAQPAWLAIFAQRAAETEAPTEADLHASGCLCTVLHFHRAGDGGTSFAIIEGVRWITLDALDQVDPYYAARVSDSHIERGDDGAIAALDRRLRDTARKVVDALPQLRQRAVELIEFIDGTVDIAQLADVVMANFARPVSESADYATEPQLARRLERAIAVLDAELARAAGAPPA